MRGATGLIALGVLASWSCGGQIAQDLLAPIPTHVEPELVEPAPLRLEWTVKAAVDIEGEPEVPSRGVAFAHQLVYAAYGSRLDARAVSDGTLVWQLHVADEILLAPLPVRGGVAVATSRGWTWIDADGRVQGELALELPPVDAVAAGAGLVQVDGAAATFIEAGAGGTVAVAWHTAVGGARALAIAPNESRALVVTDTGQVAALSLDGGARQWTSDEVNAIMARPAVTAERVYVVDENYKVYGLDLRDGDRVWVSKDIGIRTSGVPVVLDDVVWVAGMDAALHGFAQGGGSHLFRTPLSGRAYIDPVQWGRWLLASPQYGPWTLVRAPLTTLGPADPGYPRSYTIVSGADLELPPGVGPQGVALVDAVGSIYLLLPPPWSMREDEPETDR